MKTREEVLKFVYPLKMYMRNARSKTKTGSWCA